MSPTNYFHLNTGVLRQFTYDAPYLKEIFSIGSIGFQNIWWIKGTYNRPFIEDYDPVTKEFTDKSAIYFMNGNLRGTLAKKLYDHIFVGYLNYLINLKMNMSLTDLPVDIFTSMETERDRVNDKLQEYYNSAMYRGDLIN